jgi:hypothetical protein
VANAARDVIAAVGWASSGALACVGIRVYPTGSPQAFRTSWLTIFQDRLRSGAAIRWAADSVSSSVSWTVNAFPYGLAGPAGTGTASTS